MTEDERKAAKSGAVSDARSEGHEPENARAGPAALVLGLVLVSLVAISFLVGAIGRDLNRHLPAASAPATDLSPSTTLPPGPSAMDTLAAQRRRLEQEERSRLEGYRWIDRGNGIAGIPIASAMAIVGTRGIPEFEMAGRGKPAARASR